MLIVNVKEIIKGDNDMLKRIHNRNSPSLIFKGVKQLNSMYDTKPQGLWYGINKAWIKWCKGEMPHWIYKYNYELKLDLSKMLIITNKEQLINFNNKYRNNLNILTYIDWWEVAKEYSGIEINPFLHSMRFDIRTNGLWYSLWDCSSGCIWNKDVIKNIIRMKE